ncbi:hypothetical protein PTSG_06570 [Salpingoeca rosetta]|uniref:tRNA/rRNA methyltransferase SpoU type domain-containing protein n=1 Tax=Salpingoeca rosetta (strain ATCC 50818 / BSB-021) TaxID=946362 RepID=F2UG67_SALR5|nr:uncharacterized protein PTSG_06570 [Salpingoeca rosetta]EGD75495.1 hypothetical protein PTSG_06570 [Salpingoeca rosetta]|eukprot:XP_004991952.1 hypothetical protein PTSG_06570 [Salpingoeca rosetta]
MSLRSKASPLSPVEALNALADALLAASATSSPTVPTPTTAGDVHAFVVALDEAVYALASQPPADQRLAQAALHRLVEAVYPAHDAGDVAGGLAVIADRVLTLISEQLDVWNSADTWQRVFDQGAADSDSEDEDAAQTSIFDVEDEVSTTPVASDDSSRIPRTRRRKPVIPLVVLCDIATVVLTSPAWANARGPVLRDQLLPRIVSTMTQWLPHTCVSGRRQALIAITTCIIDVAGEEEAAKQIWPVLRDMTSDPEKDTGRLAVVCKLSTTLLRSDSAAVGDPILWQLVLDAVSHNDPAQRKRANHILRTWQSQLAPGTTITVTPGRPAPLVVGDECTEVLTTARLKQLQASWSMFVLVAETLEVKQIHIIRPAAQKLKALMKESMGVNAVIPLPWIEALFGLMFVHNRATARVLGVVTCLSLNFKESPHLVSAAFLYEHLVPAVASVSLYSRNINAKTDADRAPMPGPLIAPFFASLLSSPLLTHSDVIAHQRRFIAAVNTHCRHVVPFIFLAKVMVSWPKRDDTWDSASLHAFRLAAAYNCRAQEVALRNASLHVVLRVLMTNITATSVALEGFHLQPLIDLFSLFTARDCWVFGDDLFCEASAWFQSLFLEPQQQQQQPTTTTTNAAATILESFLRDGDGDHAAAPPTSQTTGTAVALLLLAAQGTDVADACFSDFWSTLRSIFTRTHMPAGRKTRLLSLFTACVELLLTADAHEPLGCRTDVILFQQRRHTTAFAQEMSQWARRNSAAAAESVMQYCLSRWTRDALAVLSDPDAFEIELDALRILAKITRSIHAAVEQRALPWAMQSEEEDRRLIGVCALACLPTANAGVGVDGVWSDDMLSERVLLLASCRVPKRSLSAEERERVPAGNMPWSRLARLAPEHCWVGVRDVLFAAMRCFAVTALSPFVPYPSTIQRTRDAVGGVGGVHGASAVGAVAGPRARMTGAGLRALLVEVTAAINSMMREETVPTITAAALAIWLTRVADVDAHAVHALLSTLMRELTAVNSHGRTVAPGLALLHAANAVVFNPVATTAAAMNVDVMAAVAQWVSELLTVAENAGREEKRGMMLSTSLWLSSTLTHANTALAVDDSTNDGHGGSDALQHAVVKGLAPTVAKMLLFGPLTLPTLLVIYDTIAYCTAEGLVTLQLPNGVTSPLDSRVNRAILLGAVFSLSPATLSLLYPALAAADDAITADGSNFHTNTLDHRSKHRCWQVLVLMADRGTDDVKDALLRRCLARFTSERHHSVRYMIEWCLMLFLAEGRLSFESLANMDTNAEARVAHICSVLTVMWRVVDAYRPRDSKWLEMCSFLLQFSLPLSLTIHMTARLYSSTTFYSVIRLLEQTRDEGNGLDIESVLRDPYLQRTKAFLEHESDVFKYVTGLRADFFFSTFDPIHDTSLEFNFTEGPVLFGLAADEALSSPLIRQFSDERALGKWAAPARAKAADALIGMRSKQEVRRMGEDESEEVDAIGNDGDEQGVGDDNEEGDGALDMGADIQKKIDPSALLAAQDEVAFGAENAAQSQRHATRQRSKLVVVASLISLGTNLGGLSRTCEIFNVGMLVLAAEKYTRTKEFRALSVTSERWQHFEFVEPANLTEWLRSMKQQGYTIVGVEQTADSVSLPQVKFPEYTVLLLGDEAKGIPADLLTETDVNVEIPQKGVTRSLNVHVSASLLIYKYAEQHVFVQ